MSSPAEMAERHGRMLAELGELGLGLARDLQNRALAAETPAEAAQLADAFHRIARSVRQSLALEAKLRRDAVRDARDERDLAAREMAAAKTARKAQLKKRVEALIWAEVDPPSVAGEMVRDVPDYLEREAESESFLDEPVEAQIARIRDVLGLDEAWDLDDEDEPQDATDDESPQDAETAADEDGPDEALPPTPRPPLWASPYDDWPNSA